MKRKYVIIGIVVVTVAFCVAFVVRTNHKVESLDSAYSLLLRGQEAIDSVNIVEAINLFQQSAASFRRLKCADGLFESSVYLSEIYELIGQKEQAYDVLRSVEERNLTKPDDYATLYYLRLMAYFLATQDKDYKRSEYYIRRAIALSADEYSRDTSLVYVDMSNLAELYIMKEDYSHAQLIVDSIQRFPAIANKLYLSQYYYCRGVLFEERGLIDSSYVSYEQCLSYSRSSSALDNALKALTRLTKIDSLRSDINPYIEHTTELFNLKELLSGREVHYKIAILEEQHKTENVLREKKSAQTIYLLSFIILVVVIILMAVLFYQYRLNVRNRHKLLTLEQEKLKATVELDKYEKELMQLTISNKDAIITTAHKENLAMSLQALGTKSAGNNLHLLEKVLKETDDEFLRNVQQRYPTLSGNDTRLMCLLKMGMTSREIATALNISTDGLYKAKYRLRKKLDVENNAELMELIGSIK